MQTEGKVQLNQDTLYLDLRAELMRKVSIDGKKVSLNALELWTRDIGLEKGLSEVVSECLLKQKARKSVQLNDTIMQELQEVQSMLEVKSQQLAKRERELATKEKSIKEQSQRAMVAVREEYERLLKEAEGRFAKEYSTMNKRLKEAERNL